MITLATETQKSYYLYHHHRQEGPFSLYDLVDQLNATPPNSQTQIFCVGWTRWVPYDDLGGIQDVCAARRKQPTQFQNDAIQKWVDSVHQEQRRRFGAGSFAQFRLSSAPKVQPPTPKLIPPPNRISWGSLLLIALGCIALGALFTLLRQPW